MIFQSSIAPSIHSSLKYVYYASLGSKLVHQKFVQRSPVLSLTPKYPNTTKTKSKGSTHIKVNTQT